jgi:hypothetical protein
MNNSIKSEIIISTLKLDMIFDSNILFNDYTEIYHTSVLVETLILMRDLIAKCHFELNTSLCFTDDIIINDKVSNISDLIILYRNVVCHIDSPDRSFSNIRTSYNFLKGKGVLLNYNGMKISCEYEDDAIFNFGGNIMYYKRHLLRAYNELKTIFQSHNVLR